MILVVLQGMWSDTEEDGKGVPTLVSSVFRCLWILIPAFCCQYIAPYLGHHLLHGLNEDTQASPTPHRKPWLDLAKKVFPSFVVLGVGTTATVLSGRFMGTPRDLLTEDRHAYVDHPLARTENIVANSVVSCFRFFTSERSS